MRDRSGDSDLKRLARWMPMSVADLTGEWFEIGLLRGRHRGARDLRQPRRSAVGRHGRDVAGPPRRRRIAGRQRRHRAGGPGALAEALAPIATRHGAAVRTDARVTHILTTGGRATRRRARERRTDSGASGGRGDQSAGRLRLDSGRAADLPPTFRERIGHIRARGVTAKINLALDGLPAFTALRR